MLCRTRTRHTKLPNKYNGLTGGWVTAFPHCYVLPHKWRFLDNPRAEQSTCKHLWWPVQWHNQWGSCEKTGFGFSLFFPITISWLVPFYQKPPIIPGLMHRSLLVSPFSFEHFHFQKSSATYFTSVDETTHINAIDKKDLKVILWVSLHFYSPLWLSVSCFLVGMDQLGTDTPSGNVFLSGNTSVTCSPPSFLWVIKYLVS